jgi:hypothetical protein
LVWGWHQLELQRQFHAPSYRTSFILCLEKSVGLVANLRFLCRINPAVSTKESL